MARSAISVTSCTKNSQAVQTETVRSAGLTGTAGLYIPASATPDDSFALYIRETADGDTGTVWIKGSSDSNYANHGQGDLAITVGGLAAVVAGPFERTRFCSSTTGTIDVDCGITGVLAVIDLR